MNKDQVKGGVKEALGKAQEGTGKIVGSDKQRAKGLAKEAEGKAQRGVGNAKEAVRSSRDRA